MPLAEGVRLGPYEIVALVGMGGMGVVYQGRDLRLDRTVAIKVLPAESPHAGSRERFYREARLLSRLSHPHICALHDIGEQDGVAFLVMEYLQGDTLDQRLRSGPLPLEEALRYALDVASALDEAHRQGIVHRDLKPSNIMLTRAGVKVLDFGLAKLREAQSELSSDTVTRDLDLTAEGVVMGTLPYMAPEQLEARPTDERTDVFALGAILYEMVTGARPFPGTSPASLVAAILTSEPEPMSARQPMAPPHLERVVRRCLAKNPEERWQTARDLAAELTFILEGRSRTAPGAPETVRQRRWRLTARRSTLALGTVLLLGLGAAAWSRYHASRQAIHSLAVLPFDNATQDPDAEYLGDGITESLIDQLSRVPSLKVMARATVFRFKGSADPQEAGRKLGVGAVVTGKVSRRGDRISIDAELMDISTGARLWGEHYDRPFADLLSVQDGIASEISDGLRLRLTGDEKRTLVQHGTENPEAYELFLKGRYLLSRDTEEHDVQARRLFLEALEKDPRFAEAHLLLASTYLRSAGGGYARPAEVWPRAEEEIRKALALEPGSVRARAMLAARRFLYDWDWAGAEREFAELSAHPPVMLGLQFRPIAVFLWARGRPQEAVAVTERALRVDPANLETRIMLADFLVQAGRLEEAKGQFRAIARDEPARASPMFRLAEILRRQGDLKGAIDALRKAYELSGEEEGTKALASARTEEDYEDAVRVVARSRLDALHAMAEERYVSPLDFARLYAMLGERDKAFASLEAALAERSARLVFLKVDRDWDPIRDDARFTAVVRRVGIP